jgi:hypothetical protein
MTLKLVELKQLLAMKRWQEWINLLLGVWMLIAPMMLGFQYQPHEARNTAWILGGILFTFTQAANYFTQPWKEGINIALGLCLVASPWVVGYLDQEIATNNAVIIGGVVIALAVWTLGLELDLRRRVRADHHAVH